MSSVQSKRIPDLDKSDAERFWALVQKDANERGCWLWRGKPSSKGYGRFKAGERVYYAHRISWALAGRDVPVDLQICHACDTPLCVNPDHLMMATDAVNKLDGKLKRNLAGKHAKVQKPRPDFPLFPHATRRWAKKIRGKLHYFGSTTADPSGSAALDKWLDQKDDLLAGRIPRVKGDGLVVRDLLNRFLTAKQHLVDTREITQRHWDDLHGTCERIKEQFGLTRLVTDLAADDFEAFRAMLSKTRGPSALSNEIQRTRAVFKFAYDNGLIDRPIRYGSSFKKPSKKIMRQTRQARGLQMFEAAEIRKMLDKAGPQLKAMILLGVNCGLGNSDVGTLPIAAVDLDRGWLNYPRPKTAVERRCPLWPETVKALKAYRAKRPTPKDEAHEGLLFVTKYGGCWAKDSKDNPVAAETRKLLREVGVTRKGLAFYGLRRTFETIAGETIDQVAVDYIMGHSPHVNDMGSVYRQRITDERLTAVVGHVRKWLFTKPRKAK